MQGLLIRPGLCSRSRYKIVKQFWTMTSINYPERIVFPWHLEKLVHRNWRTPTIGITREYIIVAVHNFPIITYNGLQSICPTQLCPRRKVQAIDNDDSIPSFFMEGILLCPCCSLYLDKNICSLYIYITFLCPSVLPLSYRYFKVDLKCYWHRSLNSGLVPVML